jgi:hypothetical protein
MNGRLSEGQCKNLRVPGSQCELLDSDGITRQYSCTVGHKCTKLLKRDSGFKTCLAMHSYPDGSETDDADLCAGGHHYRGVCVSVVEMKQAKGQEDMVAPFECDLALSFYC